ncbi:phage N-6-adenine-methyltransferase [Alteromonadaceae bacterium M269]|nr:phage N-6-adenine-methyltransferase [Alteromonadaceae bacterium M269]
MANDLWETPPEIFAYYNRRFHFVLDAAASKLNAKCEIYLTEKDDALTKDWAQIVKQNTAETPYANYVWVNCPYSQPYPWVEKALETKQNGVGVVMLLNHDNSCKWFAKALTAVNEIHCFVSNLKDRPNYRNGRIAFIHSETKEPIDSNNKPQFVLIFEPNDYDSIETKYLTLEEVMKTGKWILEKVA